MPFARKIKRTMKRNGLAPETEDDRRDRLANEIAAWLMSSREASVVARKAARDLSVASGELCGPMDVAIPFVHVEQSAWLEHLGIQLGTGDRIYARNGYVSGSPVDVSELMDVAPFLMSEILGELKDGMRVNPANQSNAFVVHQDGHCEFFYFPLVSMERPQRAEEASADVNSGYDLAEYGVGRKMSGRASSSAIVTDAFEAGMATVFLYRLPPVSMSCSMNRRPFSRPRSFPRTIWRVAGEPLSVVRGVVSFSWMPHPTTGMALTMTTTLPIMLLIMLAFLPATS